MSLEHIRTICIDLDGTLIKDDVTLIAFKKVILNNPLMLFSILYWLLIGGRAKMKKKLATMYAVPPKELSYNEKFLKYIKLEKEKGVKLYLATACDEIYANAIATYLGIFDDVFASDGVTNLRAEAKAQKLVSEFGDKGFIYAGNSIDDLKVWKNCAFAIVVTPNAGVLKKMPCNNYILFE